MGFANKNLEFTCRFRMIQFWKRGKPPPVTVVLLQIQCNKSTSHQKLENLSQMWLPG